MTTTAMRPQRPTGSLVLLLGASTMAVALLDGVFFETYEGPGLIGFRTVGAGGLSLFLLAATLIAFVLVARRQPVTRSVALGLILATSAYPVTFLLASATPTVLNTLGIYW